MFDYERAKRMRIRTGDALWPTLPEYLEGGFIKKACVEMGYQHRKEGEKARCYRSNKRVHDYMTKVSHQPHEPWPPRDITRPAREAAPLHGSSRH